MPVNKNSISRYLLIDQALGSNRRCSSNDLLEYVNRHLPEDLKVNIRTLQKDLRNMGDLFGIGDNIARERSGRTFYYKYKDNLKTILQNRLSDKEKTLLMQFINYLSMSNLQSMNDWVDRIVDKFNMSAPRQIIDFAYSDISMRNGIFLNLFDAIFDNRPIVISYMKYGSTAAVEHIVYPYKLKEYNGRWFLICKEKNYQSYSTYIIENIVELSYARNEEFIPADDSLDTFFDNVIGVSVLPSEPVDIIFCASTIGDFDKRVEKKALFSSQFTCQNQEYLHAKYPALKDWKFYELRNIIPNNELYQTLCSYIGNLLVVEPEDIRLEMSRRVSRLNGLYSQLNSTPTARP